MSGRSSTTTLFTALAGRRDADFKNDDEKYGTSVSIEPHPLLVWRSKLAEVLGGDLGPLLSPESPHSPDEGVAEDVEISPYLPQIHGTRSTSSSPTRSSHLGTRTTLGAESVADICDTAKHDFAKSLHEKSDKWFGLTSTSGSGGAGSQYSGGDKETNSDSPCLIEVELGFSTANEAARTELAKVVSLVYGVDDAAPEDADDEDSAPQGSSQNFGSSGKKGGDGKGKNGKGNGKANGKQHADGKKSVKGMKGKKNGKKGNGTANGIEAAGPHSNFCSTRKQVGRNAHRRRKMWSSNTQRAHFLDQLDTDASLQREFVQEIYTFFKAYGPGSSDYSASTASTSTADKNTGGSSAATVATPYSHIRDSIIDKDILKCESRLSWTVRSAKRQALWYRGRYNKYSREVSQTVWHLGDDNDAPITAAKSKDYTVDYTKEQEEGEHDQSAEPDSKRRKVDSQLHRENSSTTTKTETTLATTTPAPASTTTKTEYSVEELIALGLQSAFGPSSNADPSSDHSSSSSPIFKFHAAGREDVDVRMLGAGRPFILEITDARRRLGEAELTDLWKDFGVGKSSRGALNSNFADVETSSGRLKRQPLVTTPPVVVEGTSTTATAATRSPLDITRLDTTSVNCLGNASTEKTTVVLDEEHTLYTLAGALVRVRHLRPCSKEYFQRLQKSSEEHTKVYGCLIESSVPLKASKSSKSSAATASNSRQSQKEHSASAATSSKNNSTTAYQEEDERRILDFLTQRLIKTSSFPIRLKQQTPFRVLHRRPNLIREKEILEIKDVQLVFDSDEETKNQVDTSSKNTAAATKTTNKFRVKVHASAGCYIKELVNGDFGRTKPSFRDLLFPDRTEPVELEMLALDVEDVIDEE
ncbi:unnamed protein product [Amoebophrya sp. A25]|nr:unnamed protein product [Amoebophrya sp. A25]|eukprot:GSA25T00020880001.1